MAAWNRNVSMRALRAFCAAAECGSFRLAADELFLTASAVSHQIKQLEAELGCKLFERTPRALLLTDAGCQFYDDLRPVLAELDDVTARHSRAAPRRSLRISVQPFFASELFVPRLPEFVTKHPDIDISVDTSDESPEKHPVGADVSIRIFRTAPESLVSERLFQLRLTPAGSPDFYDGIKVKAGRITSEFPLVVHESRSKAWRQWERSSRIKVPDHHDSIRLDSMIAVARAAERGMGAALVPKQLSGAWFETGSLVPLFEHELITRDAFYIVSKKESDHKQEIGLFRTWVLQNFAEPK
jgi:LysR family glycine cleavage system transcriptional activator